MTGGGKLWHTKEVNGKIDAIINFCYFTGSEFQFDHRRSLSAERKCLNIDVGRYIHFPMHKTNASSQGY